MTRSDRHRRRSLPAAAALFAWLAPFAQSSMSADDPKPAPSTAPAAAPVPGPKAVALAIGKLLDEPETAERMGRAGRDRVESEFTWDGQAAKLVELLGRAANGMGR